MSKPSASSTRGASIQLDRRTFLGHVGLAAGGIVVSGVLPVSALQAATQPSPVAPAEAEGDWHVDDMWGTYPRYSHPIPYAPPREYVVSTAHVDPVDYIFVV